MIPKYFYIGLVALAGLALLKKITTKSSANEKQPKLKNITDSSFKKDIIQNTKSDVFVKYYTNWCGYCNAFKPIWSELSELDIPNVQIAEVDCEKNKKICESQNVTGYPTLIYYPKNSKGNGIRFKDLRELDNLKTFINQNA